MGLGVMERNGLGFGIGFGQVKVDMQRLFCTTVHIGFGFGRQVFVITDVVDRTPARHGFINRFTFCQLFKAWWKLMKEVITFFIGNTDLNFIKV